MAGESALVVLVPEAEPAVASFRDRFDPSAGIGVPAHITLLYPFKPPEAITATDLAVLAGCFAGYAPFAFRLATMQRFPSVLYLQPEPQEPLRQLTRAIWRLFPETPPYGGKYGGIHPHLTVAQVGDEHLLDRIAEDFARASVSHLPIDARAERVALLENRTGRWQQRTELVLGGGGATA